MPTIVVPLDNILTDAANPVDLSALPADQAIERIKEIYSFLPSSAEVTVGNGVATITTADERTRPVNQALRTLEQASRLAKQGKYGRAIPLFQEVLRVIPEHTEARRELAMALMETGSIVAAKKHLIRVLQLDPNDAWATLCLPYRRRRNRSCFQLNASKQLKPWPPRYDPVPLWQTTTSRHKGPFFRY